MSRLDKKQIKADKGPSEQVHSISSHYGYLTSLSTFANLGSDPAHLNWLTKRLMKRDPVLSFGVEFMKSMIGNQKYQIHCDDPVIQAAHTANFKPCYPKLVRRAMDAYYWGLMPFEKRWMTGPLQVKIKDGKTTRNKRFRRHYLIKSYKDLNPEAWQPRYDPYNDKYLGLYPTSYPYSDSKHIPFYKTFIMTFGEEFGDKMGRSRMDYAYKSWYSYKAIRMFADRHMERKADPNTVGMAPVGTSKDQNGVEVPNAEYMLQLLERMRGGNPVVLTTRYNEKGKLLFDIKEFAATERSEAFIDYLYFLSCEKLMALWLPPNALMAGHKTGSYAESDILVDIALKFIEKDSKLFEEYINLYILPQLTYYNFGVDAMYNTPSTFETLGFKRVDKVLLGHVFSDILAAQREVGGKKISNANQINIEELCKETNLPYLTPEEAVNEGATAEVSGNVEAATKTRVDTRAPGSRTKQPKPGERVPTMPGK